MEVIIDSNKKFLYRQDIDFLLSELNKELRRKFKHVQKDFKADLYIVGGACVVTSLQSRESTLDIDAAWTIGAEMRDCINIVADKYALSHDWCNCDFKRTRSFTKAIYYNNFIYKQFDRLIVRVINPDLLLAMKLISFREHKMSDILDAMAAINVLRSKGIKVDQQYCYNLLNKYYEKL